MSILILRHEIEILIFYDQRSPFEGYFILKSANSECISKFNKLFLENDDHIGMVDNVSGTDAN